MYYWYIRNTPDLFQYTSLLLLIIIYYRYIRAYIDYCAEGAFKYYLSNPCENWLRVSKLYTASNLLVKSMEAVFWGFKVLCIKVPTYLYTTVGICERRVCLMLLGIIYLYYFYPNECYYMRTYTCNIPVLTFFVYTDNVNAINKSNRNYFHKPLNKKITKYFHIILNACNICRW